MCEYFSHPYLASRLDTKMNLNIKPNMDQNEIEELKKAQQIYIRVAGSAIGDFLHISLIG